MLLELHKCLRTTLASKQDSVSRCVHLCIAPRLTIQVFKAEGAHVQCQAGEGAEGASRDGGSIGLRQQEGQQHIPGN